MLNNLLDKQLDEEFDEDEKLDEDEELGREEDRDEVYSTAIIVSITRRPIGFITAYLQIIWPLVEMYNIVVVVVKRVWKFLRRRPR